MFLRLVERMLALQPVLPQPRSDADGSDPGAPGTPGTSGADRPESDRPSRPGEEPGDRRLPDAG